MLSTTVSALVQGLEHHMPGSIYSKFCAWCLSERNPQRKVLIQVLGISQLVNLTAKLFEGLLSDQEWEALLPYCATMNAYLTCEAVSDNVAIGLARPKPKDVKAEARRQVVSAFNTATVERLKGTPGPARAMLAPVEEVTRTISMFKSSLSPEKLLYLAVSSLKEKPSWSMADLNASLQAVLVANAETCQEVAQAIDTLPGSAIVRQGLMDRYDSVNDLLANKEMSREERVRVGAHAILVSPTIGYYVTVLADKIRPQTGFADLVEDGTLETALYDAALLVRLLNDLGTPILTMTGTERKQLVGQLEECWQTQFTSAHTLFEVLAKFSETCNDLTRIRKDTLFGEYNLALDLLPPESQMETTLAVFEENLGYYSELYGKHWQRLKQNTDRITEYLQDDLVSQVILRFVKFHEMLYSNAFDSAKGEYAV
jgi:hypothetical protein